MQENANINQDSITLSNLERLSEKQSHLEEQRICELHDFASNAVDITLDMLADGYDVYEILSYITGGIPGQYSAIHDSVLAENRSRLLEYAASLERMDRVIFAQLLLEQIRERGCSLSESDFLKTDHSGERIAYVKNSLSDEAYDVFSQDLAEPRLTYTKDFKSTVDAVLSGEAEYCLLPLEEKGGARISSVAELIFKYDLKINSVTPVFGLDGIADMKYAMVSKNFTLPKLDEGDDRYLEIRIRVDTSASLGEILTAAECFGASVYRANTITFTTDDGDVAYYSVVLKDAGEDFAPLLVYLTLFSGAYTPVGIYKNLE